MAHSAYLSHKGWAPLPNARVELVLVGRAGEQARARVCLENKAALGHGTRSH